MFAGIVTLLPSGKVIVPPEAAEMDSVVLAIVPATTIETDADFVLSAAVAPVTVTVKGVGTAAGAVYRPAEVTVPTVEFPPATPLTDQFTDELKLPVPCTAAEH
jgi:hypothetical protein